jgi:sortase A
VTLADYSSRILLGAGGATLAWVGYAWWGAARVQDLTSEQPKVIVVQEAPLRRGDPIGRLSVPRLGLSVLVLEGTDGHTLRVAAGHVPGTALPGVIGNTVIAAHRDTFFRGLRDIRRDDVITLSVSGAMLRYRVEGTEIVGPRDVEVMNGTAGAELTLITCYPFYYVGPAPKRFIVHAQLDPVGMG